MKHCADQAWCAALALSMCLLPLLGACPGPPAREPPRPPRRDPAPPAAETRALHAYRLLLSRIADASARREAVPLSRLLREHVGDLPEACDVKSAGVRVLAAKPGLSPQLDAHPGALLLVTPSEYVACADQEPPPICAVGVTLGTAGAEPRLVVSEPTTELRGDAQVLSAAWSLRPGSQALLTLRTHSEAEPCQGADSETSRADSVSFWRFHDGRFTLLLDLVERGITRPPRSMQAYAQYNRWRWHPVGAIPGRTAPEWVLAAVTRLRRPGSSPPDGLPGGTDACQRFVTLYRFTAAGDALKEAEGPARRVLLEDAELQRYQGLESESCDQIF